MGYTGEQKRRYQREWMATRRAAWFKAHGPCVDCGSWDQLELDHIDPALKVTHLVWSWTLERREEELAKCVARCKQCHRERTNQQQSKQVCCNGHDKDVTGRDTDGSCAECRRENQRRYRPSRSSLGK